ncbi:uncharacterized protein BDW70DRAFT_161911 [Aspergillus foveolatus]|uniref:uncharacterized protein n=1 Tax=Aspergillus foveolatus TaxID=210207 RepID=UPI003CCD69C6
MAMASNSSSVSCPVPFIAEISIGDTGGYLAGRWCEPQLVGNETVSCCFPCPFTDWQYSDGLGNEMVPWLALVVLVFVVIGALTYILLPAEDTRRHYLVISPLMGFVFMPLAFIVPLGGTARQCYDAITPNYWLSDMTCAWTGSLILYGAWVLVIGCFFRSLALYVRLIWDVEPGTVFRWISITTIFGGAAGMLGVALGVSGVSYQVGEMCYISYKNSIASFWGPLIGIAFISWLITVYIFGYTIRGVLTRGGTAHIHSIFKKRDDGSDPLSRALQIKTMGRNLWLMIKLQWRAIAVSCLLLVFVAYVGNVNLRWGSSALYSEEDLMPWISCLVATDGDKHACSDEASAIGPDKKTGLSSVTMISSCGVLGIICTVRYTMILAWIDWFRDLFDVLAGLFFRRRQPNRNSSSMTINPRDEAESGRRRSDDYDIELASTSTADTHPGLAAAVDYSTKARNADKQCKTCTYHIPQDSLSKSGGGL